MEKYDKIIVEMNRPILRPLPVTSGRCGTHQKLRLKILGGSPGGDFDDSSIACALKLHFRRFWRSSAKKKGDC